MKTVSVYRCQGTNNVGDLNSSPLLYFDYPEPVFCDAKTGVYGALPEEAGLYIFGGGALSKKVAGCVQNSIAIGPKISWGIGQSFKSGPYRRFAETTVISDMMRDYNFLFLQGSRDLGTKDTVWVPCASCMSPLFDKEYPIEHDVIMYLNTVKEFKDPTCLNNRQSFEETIRFIASGRVVLTDSYHGAYWATLLGRTAIIINAYSSKFYQYKHQPVIVEDVRGLMEAPKVYPEALKECREANIQFDAKVRQAIGIT